MSAYLRKLLAEKEETGPKKAKVVKVAKQLNYLQKNNNIKHY